MANYDLIIIGGGHAGIEAAIAASKMGIVIAIITFDSNKLGTMSCNPALGGLAKSHLIKEIDALGGIMARAGDKSAIQYRILNRRKGAAVRATRTQNDREQYQEIIKAMVEEFDNIHILEDEAIDIIIEDDKIAGVITKNFGKLRTKALIISAGTFLKGKILWGDKEIPSGRRGDPASNLLSDVLKSYGLNLRRFKTGTPARIIKDTVDFSKMTRQDGDEDYFTLSLFSEKDEIKQIPCWVTNTNNKTHEIIRNNLSKSALYSGKVDAVSTRYCPSVEDKIVRFAHHNSHQLVLEPEGRQSKLMYLNGFSNSLPSEIQDKLLLTLPGLENAKIQEYAYAIEYDAIDPTILDRTLEMRDIEGLYFAGQINGTSGYEEAGAQGQVAGINAAAKIIGKKPYIPIPEQSYTGVMIRDLTAIGVNEPYRLFTARAEFRLLLREDNAHRRLFEIAKYYSLLDNNQLNRLEKMISIYESELERIKNQRIEIPKYQNKNKTIYEYFRLPNSSYDDLDNVPEDIDEHIKSWCRIEAKYSGYIVKERAKISRLKKMMGLTIPKDIYYSEIGNLSNEAIEKISRIKPKTLRDVSEIPGISIAHIMALGNYIKNNFGED